MICAGSARFAQGLLLAPCSYHRKITISRTMLCWSLSQGATNQSFNNILQLCLYVYFLFKYQSSSVLWLHSDTVSSQGGTWKLTPLNSLGLRESTVRHKAGELILSTRSEICMHQEIERPVLAEWQVWLLHSHLLPILQQINFNLGWMEPRHIAIQVIWLSILCWMPWVNLNLWRTWGTLGKDKKKIKKKN